MESKWYLFPGQTTENTNISDRAHALHITEPAWNNITQHLDRKKRIQEAIDKERAHREALKKGSEAMTKQWENSVENLRLKKEKERHDPFDKNKEGKIQTFYKMRAEQEVLRKQYVEKVKKGVFVSSGFPKELTSALILSETLHEREKQKEFNDKVKKHDEEVKQKYDQRVMANDEKHRTEEKEKKLKKLEEERRIAAILREQYLTEIDRARVIRDFRIKENEETKKADNRAKVERETLDGMNAAREEKLLKQFELEEKKRKMHEMAMEKKRELEAEHKRQETLARENLEMEMATQFYSEAKHRINCMMKRKEKEMQEEAIRKRSELAQKAAALQEAKDAADDERIAKVVAERDALDQAKAEEKKAVRARYVQERIEDRQNYLKRLEDENNVEREVKRWELLNRCKAAEVMKEYDERNRKQKWARILEYRRDLFEQMADDKETMKREKEIEEIMSRVSFAEDDKMFNEYANEILELAKTKGRSTYPIEKVISEYKKTYNALPAPRRYCKCTLEKEKNQKK